ncbi:CapA family protein [Mucilaginibacter hurinus]|uniref:CapA family protein n=1 Tax=Mucilaginibacter hurinus TaxID=2201324 RepID=A0A367GP53_9SPHI|nr:CapA family protein [Mucilaginibacter hurinus]RCH54473.1 CapA family protein [Mucilaginibacter hurinus]
MSVSKLIIGLLCAVLCACQPGGNTTKNEDATDSLASQVVTVKSLREDSIVIAAVGDIMLGTSYPNASTLPPDGGKRSFNAVMDDLKNADLTFGNLEGVLLDTGAAAHYKLHQKSKAYMFRMPQKYVWLLKDAGFDLLSIANNHIGDFAGAGRASTMKMLDSAGIRYAGLRSHPTAIINVKDIVIGFSAFSPNSNTVPFLDLKNASRIIGELKQQTDIVIVSFHGGGEGTEFEHVPFKTESYNGENRGDVHAFAHNAVDAGADLVLGHGPHLTRAVERYKNRLIAYSLGNFCTYRGINVTGLCGIAPLLKINVNKKGEFISAKIIATQQTHPGGLKRDTTKRVIKRMKFLTETDFPQSGLHIDDNGLVTPVN